MRNTGIGLVIATLVGVAGCGDNKTAGDDMGVADMSVGDMPSARPDMTMPLMLGGSKIVSGAAQIVTVNEDGYLIYFATGGIKAVKLDGTGDTVAIPNGSWVSPWKKAVFGWELAADTDPVGKLHVWKAGATVRQVAASSIHPSSDKTLSGAAASDDGMKILYSTGAAADGSTTNIELANFDGTGSPVSVLTNVPTGGACELTMGFTGNKFFVGYCTAQPTTDGGIATATVIAVDPTNGNKTTLFTGARNFFSVDTAGSKAFGISTAQQPMWVATTGGAPTMITSDTVRGEVGLINPAGNNIVWVTTTNKLMRLDVSSAGQTPVEITTGLAAMAPSAGLLAVSPDFSKAMIAKQVDTQAGTTDVILTSLTAAGQLTTLVSTATGAVFGDGFTKDNARVLYYSDVAMGAGTLHSKPVAGGADVQLATDVWVEYPGAGATIAFTDRYHDGANGGLVDLKTIAAAGGTATLISTNIDDIGSTGFHTRDGSKLLYTYTGRPSTAVGVYLFNIPQ